VRTTGAALALSLALALVVDPAFASEAAEAAEHGAHHGPDWAYFFYHAFGLAVLLGIIGYYTRTPLANFLKDRSDEIRRRIEAAVSALAAARAESAELSARVARLAAENEDLVRQAAEQAEAERVQALERARQAAERIREEAKLAADQEIVRARRELRDEAATLATRLAGEMLRQSVTAEDDKRIVGEFVERVGAAR
jgi:F-type H+-transporting ATPase subunit b